MASLLYVFNHPLQVVVFFSLVATALAALAWRRSGAIIGLILAPSWGAAFTMSELIESKPADVAWSHVVQLSQLIRVLDVFFGGTAIWLLAAIPGILIGLAVRSLSGYSNSKPAAAQSKTSQ
jgi:hypothetical protein